MKKIVTAFLLFSTSISFANSKEGSKIPEKFMLAALTELRPNDVRNLIFLHVNDAHINYKTKEQK